MASHNHLFTVLGFHAVASNPTKKNRNAKRVFLNVPQQQQQQQQTRSTKIFSNDPNYNNIVGLNEDGDFAMLGVNMEDDERKTERGQDALSLLSNGDLSFLKLSSSQNDYLSTQSSSSTTATNRIPDTSNHFETMASPPPPSSSSSSSSSSQHYNNSDFDNHDANDNSHQREVFEMEQWLQTDVMPTLERMYIKSYARNLVAIGFHPDCVTRFELTMEDLTFMKLLHRKFFYHEIIGTNTK